MQRLALRRLAPHVDYATRTIRRLRVIALYGGWLPLIPTFAAIRAAHRSVIAYVALGFEVILFALFCYGLFTLLQLTFVNAPNLDDALLDERQRARRDRVILRSYRILGMVLCVAPLWVMVASSSPQWPWLRDPDLLAFAAWSIVLLAMTLPTAMLAWSEPDDIDR